MMLNILIADDNINLVELIFKQIIRKKKSKSFSDLLFSLFFIHRSLYQVLQRTKR